MRFLDNSGNWSQWDSLPSAILHAPSAPGIYVIGRREFSFGLPAEPIWAYIGRSDNLKRRLREHLPINEMNSGLRNWLLNTREKIEVWYQQTTAHQSRQLERNLVRGLEPLFNEIKFKGDFADEY